MYLSVIGDNCGIMSDDYELTMDYDMVLRIGKGFQIDRYYFFIFGTFGWHVWAVVGKKSWY